MNQTLAFNNPTSFQPLSSETPMLANFASGNPPQLYHNNYIEQGQNQAFAYGGQSQDGVNFHASQRPTSGQSAADARMMQHSNIVYNLQPAPAQASPIRQAAASPPQRLSPNNAASQYHAKANSLTLLPWNNTYPMAAAPPISSSQSPGTTTASQYQTPTAGNNSTTAPSTPQSPTTANREQARIALILSINQDLLAEINRLQALSQGGAVNPQQAAQLRNAGQADKMASEDYIQLLRRVQGNLAYLMPRANNNSNTSNSNDGTGNNNTKILPGPAFMQHPPQLPALKEKYERLRELFPDWAGNDAKLMAIPAAGGSGGAGSPAQQQQQQRGQQQQQQQQNANGVATSMS